MDRDRDRDRSPGRSPSRRANHHGQGVSATNAAADRDRDYDRDHGRDHDKSRSPARREAGGAGARRAPICAYGKEYCPDINTTQGCDLGAGCSYVHSTIPCKNVATPHGCRRGDSCTFLHPRPAAAAAPPARGSRSPRRPGGGGAVSATAMQVRLDDARRAASRQRSAHDRLIETLAQTLAEAKDQGDDAGRAEEEAARLERQWGQDLAARNRELEERLDRLERGRGSPRRDPPASTLQAGQAQQDHLVSELHDRDATIVQLKKQLAASKDPRAAPATTGGGSSSGGGGGGGGKGRGAAGRRPSSQPPPSSPIRSAGLPDAFGKDKRTRAEKGAAKERAKGEGPGPEESLTTRQLNAELSSLQDQLANAGGAQAGQGRASTSAGAALSAMASTSMAAGTARSHGHGRGQAKVGAGGAGLNVRKILHQGSADKPSRVAGAQGRAGRQAEAPVAGERHATR